MEKFIKTPKYVKFFPILEGFGIANMGYNDFSKVSAGYGIRMLSRHTWHVVISGKGFFEIYGKRYHLHAGQIFFVPPDTLMSYYPDREDPWEYVWFTLYGEDEIAKCHKSLSVAQNNPVITVKYFDKLKRNLGKTFDAFLNGTGGHFCALSCFYQMMDICTSYTPVNEMQGVKNIIDESFALQGFNVEQLCSEVGISHPHLLRRFKEAYGTTIVKYILSKRMEYACELLTTTDMSVNAVAHSCGFTDELHFMKTFKSRMGVSALTYRKER